MPEAEKLACTPGNCTGGISVPKPLSHNHLYTRVADPEDHLGVPTFIPKRHDDI